MKVRDVDAFLSAPLDAPPPDRASLDRLLGGLPERDRNALRDAVIRRLGEAVEPSGRHIDILGVLLAHLGVGSAQAALAKLVDNPARDISVRRVAADALIASGRAGLLESLQPDVADAIFTDLVRIQLKMLDAPGAFLASVLSKASRADGQGAGEAALIAFADQVRRELGRGYAEFFVPLIERAGKTGKPPAAPIVAALVALRGLSGDAERKAVQKAVLETGTAGIAPAPAPRSAPAGAKGYLGSADGAGALVVLATLSQPDGTATLINVCYRLIGDVRDGFVLPRQRKRDIEDVIGQLRAASAFVETRFEHVAGLCVSAADRTLASGIDLPKDAVPAVRLLRPFAVPVAFEDTAPAPRITLGAVRALLSREQYSAWFFDIGDFAKPVGTR